MMSESIEFIEVAEGVKCPCGYIDATKPVGIPFSQISCQMSGCKGCKHFNGTEYFTRNIPKGVGIWAKEQLKEMKKSGS